MPIGDYEKTSPLPDSGERTSYDTGAVRDSSTGKGTPHMIPPCAILRLGKLFEAGALKYGNLNFMKGIPLGRYHDSILRHLTAWAQGDKSEDHAAAVLWNMACAMWTEEEMEKGSLPPTLMTLPYRK